jgi:hypothetical protein
MQFLPFLLKCGSVATLEIAIKGLRHNNAYFWVGWIYPLFMSSLSPSELPKGKDDCIDETPEQALERRMKESARVEEKIRYIYNRDDFHRELAEGGKNLIVLEVSEGPISPKR